MNPQCTNLFVLKSIWLKQWERKTDRQKKKQENDKSGEEVSR